jgi:hypothetical protein
MLTRCVWSHSTGKGQEWARPVCVINGFYLQAGSAVMVEFGDLFEGEIKSGIEKRAKA